MKPIKVSVIVPIYGVEKYIEKCARSLFKQTMRDGIEFVFVNDCTKDRSMEILQSVLKEFPDRHSQVKIISHTENQGLAEARVTGLKGAAGEYVIHCDSDDWISPEMYEKLYNEAIKTNADIVGCDTVHVYPDKLVMRKENFALPQTDLVSELIMDREVGAYLWNRLIRREFYLKGGFRAKKGTTLLEDMAVTVPLHSSTNKVAYVTQNLYYYRRTNAESMSGLIKDSSMSSALNVLLSLTEMPLQKEWILAIKNRLQSFLFMRIMLPRNRDTDGWRRIELPFINIHKIRLNASQTIAKFLAEKQKDHILYCFMIANKLFNPIIWYHRLNRRIRWVKGK